VHSVVSLDFAISLVPGWHSTLFPPFFVAGAIYSGFAMVLTLVIPLRRVYRLKNYITTRHLELMAKVLMVTGWIVLYGYYAEFYDAWRGGDIYERFMAVNRAVGPYAPWFWLLVVCNLMSPQLLWFKSMRRHPVVLWVVSIFVNIGMWLERFIIVITSLHRDFLPSSWGMYYPTFWDWSTLIGTIGFFFALVFLFVRYLPAISISEMRKLVVEERDPAKHSPDSLPGLQPNPRSD
jgi:molybdopterin-containing oxidoreductase family membrane subunit